MKSNMGTADRVVRSLVALAIVGLYASGAIGGTAAILLGVLAAVLLLTSLVGWCPAYLPFGISTCQRADSSR